MTKIKIFQPKEVMQAYRKWMKENHAFDRVYDIIGCFLSAGGIAWGIENDSDLVAFIAVFPIFTVLLLQMYRNNQYNKQASAELQRI